MCNLILVFQYHICIKQPQQSISYSGKMAEKKSYADVVRSNDSTLRTRPRPTEVPKPIMAVRSTGTLKWQDVTYNILNVPGDGNCFFHCLSLSLNGDFSSTRRLRRSICHHVVENWNNYEERIHIFHNPNMTCERYLRKMVNGNGWATSAEIEAASDLLARNINVLFRGENGRVLSHKFRSPRNQQGNYIVVVLENSHFRLAVSTTEYQSRIQIQNASETVKVTANDAPRHQPTLTGTVTESKKQKLSKKKCLSGRTENFRFSSNDKICTGSKKVSQQGNYNYLNCQLTNECTKTNECRDQNKLEETSAKRAKVILVNSTTSQENTNNNYLQPETTRRRKPDDWQEKDLQQQCRKLGIPYFEGAPTETKDERKKRRRQLMSQIRSFEKVFGVSATDLPKAPPMSEDEQFNKAMDAIRQFELRQMSYKIVFCTICKEINIDGKQSDGICKRCNADKNSIKMFSAENKMDPGIVPNELQNLTMVEEQLICRISPCISIHMLKHGGVGSTGHCITFPQDVNEPSRIFPRLPSEINMIKVRKQGRQDTSKEFLVRRYKIQRALQWLKANNPVYSDIQISEDRLMCSQKKENCQRWKLL